MTQPSSDVVVLFDHPLLGHGIAAYLSRAGVEPVLVPSGDLDAVIAALGPRTVVVVLERSSSGSLLNPAEYAPDAVVVDVTDAVSTGPVPRPVGVSLENLLDLVRSRRAAVA